MVPPVVMVKCKSWTVTNLVLAKMIMPIIAMDCRHLELVTIRAIKVEDHMVISHAIRIMVVVNKYLMVEALVKYLELVGDKRAVMPLLLVVDRDLCQVVVMHKDLELDFIAVEEGHETIVHFMMPPVKMSLTICD